MTRAHDDRATYVRRVQEGTQRFTQDLVCEVERLQGLASVLEAEMRQLTEQVFDLREASERHHDEQARLCAQLAETRSESQRYAARYAEIETHNSNLAHLYLASYRLHGSLSCGEVVDSIWEITANLIGCEQAALYELAAGGRSLRVMAAFGLAPEACPQVVPGEGRIGEAVRSGETFVADPASPPEEHGLTACIPLSLDGQVRWAIAIFRLLPRKAGYEEVDRELFALLATHAATALHCSTLHARFSGDAGR